MTLQEMGIKFSETRSERDFNLIYQRLKPSIFNYLRELVPDIDNRNEVIATTFAKVWAKIDQYDSYWNFSTWVYRIARNEALLFYRANKNTYSYDSMTDSGINLESKYYEEIPEEELQHDPVDSLHTLAISEILNLPDIYKTVLSMREIEKKKYEEIADLLGWNHNTVRTRIRKARELVKSSLCEKHPDLVKQYHELI